MTKVNIKNEIQEANQFAVGLMLQAQPSWVDVKPAGEVIPGMSENMLLHAGPPQDYSTMCGPQRGAAWGALIFEGIARNADEADQILKAGEVVINSAHDHNSVSGAGHMISYHQPVVVVNNGERSYFTNLKEDTFHALRYGSYDDHTIDKLHWLAEVIAPALSIALNEIGGVNVRDIISKSLYMGDEGHNRNQAQTCLFEQKIMPSLLESDLSRNQILEVARMLQHDENFFLYPVMAASKAMTHAGHGIEKSSVVTVMARNGTEFGIKISGLGDKWFTCPAPIVQGLYFPGYTQDDANPDLGDSCVTEASGIGGFAMAASPAIVHFGSATGLGGSVKDAINYTREMYEITVEENNAYQIAYLDFRGCPTGIDMLRVLKTGIQPIINTSISPREPGRGQVGAGLVRAPMGCFKNAFLAFADKYSLS